MLRIMNYATPESLDEAYALLTKNKKNMILGGMIWLKMEDIQIPTAIDLSKLGLDQIEEEDAEFKIGAMVTLRQLETHESFNKATCHVFRDAVKDIVGVQLRNLATVGGSVYSRFSFSDVICSLLCLECDVQTHAHGRISLEEFISLHMKGYSGIHLCKEDEFAKCLCFSKKKCYGFKCFKCILY